MKGWFMKIINAREQYMGNRPYSSMEALEDYAENTYSALMYLTLAFLPVTSLSVDHVASHIGKAAGITAVLRGLPLVAFPSPSSESSDDAGKGSSRGFSLTGRQGAVMLPLDVMAEAGVKEEEVFRQGAEAPGLKEAVFKVATRAHDHLITAHEMLNNLSQGKAPGHAFEYEGQEGHFYTETNRGEKTQLEDIERGFGVLLSSVSTKLWLERLQVSDFDVFKPQLRTRDWKLPWRAYWAYTRKQI
ncbi:MAG: hypothetical protein M1818_001440 [Claussenomyces sp. TS43310]|nr:MAG: hypothetical protein M1818_001440 [Claussenomyces sp. TS43310]